MSFLRNTWCYGPRLVTPIRKFTRVSLSLSLSARSVRVTRGRKKLSVCRSVRPSDSYVDFYLRKKKLSVCLLPTIDKNCDLCLPYRTTV